MGEEKSRVRGKYVSVERVREIDDGKQVEWRMATSSDAGGRFLFPFLARQQTDSCHYDCLVMHGEMEMIEAD